MRSTTRFLLVSAILETPMGLGLLLLPALVGGLLIGAGYTDADAPIVRLGGAALTGLGIACWFVRGDAQGGAARGHSAAMLVYYVLGAIVLAAAGMSQPGGIALWPAVIVHVVMAGWCVAVLLAKPV
jgi:hypothetical protein